MGRPPEATFLTPVADAFLRSNQNVYFTVSPGSVSLVALNYGDKTSFSSICTPVLYRRVYWVCRGHGSPTYFIQI